MPTHFSSAQLHALEAERHALAAEKDYHARARRAREDFVRTLEVQALTTRVVCSTTQLERGSENHAIAVDFVRSHLRHHQFPEAHGQGVHRQCDDLVQQVTSCPVTLADTCGQYFHFLRQLDRHCQHAKAEVLLSLCAKIE